MSTYEGKFWCSNCQTSFSSNIPKGTTIVKFARSLECTNCGTKSVKPSDNQ